MKKIISLTLIIILTIFSLSFFSISLLNLEENNHSDFTSSNNYSLEQNAQVSLGYVHSAAIDSNGDLWTWGR